MWAKLAAVIITKDKKALQKLLRSLYLALEMNGCVRLLSGSPITGNFPACQRARELFSSAGEVSDLYLRKVSGLFLHMICVPGGGTR